MWDPPRLPPRVGWSADAGEWVKQGIGEVFEPLLNEAVPAYGEIGCDEIVPGLLASER